MGQPKGPYSNRGPTEALTIATALPFDPPMVWVHVVSAGSGGLVVKDEAGTAKTYTGLVAGDVLVGPFSELTSMSLSKIRYGDGQPPRSTTLAPGTAPVAGSGGPALAIAVSNQATLSGLAQKIDGVALSSAGMRVYLAKQTTASQQGFWLVQSGNWTRPADWASGATIPLGTQISVAPGGTANFASFGSTWYVDAATDVVDTGTITAYPIACKGQTALASASPSTVTVSSLWIKSATTSSVSADNMTTAANGIKSALTAGASTGTLVLTGPNTVTDTVAWIIYNG